MKRFAIIAVVSLVALIAAGPSIRGYPVGKVAEVDRAAGVVSVDMGKKDWVYRGFKFAVVDEKGRQVAAITAKEVYDDLFWSEKLPPGKLADVQPGMEVRWVLKPETTAFVEAMKRGTVQAYRRYIEVFPDSPFTAELIGAMPEEKLKALDPEYYDAWKRYTKESFAGYIEKHKESGFARAAKRELASIESYEKEKENERLERAKRAEESEAVRKKQEALEEKIKAKEQQAQPGFEMKGSLINNSGTPVRFVFDPPSQQMPVNVPQNGNVELKLPQGNISYKVYSLEEKTLPPLPDEQPKPLKEGTAEIQFDLWQITYP